MCLLLDKDVTAGSMSLSSCRRETVCPCPHVGLPGLKAKQWTCSLELLEFLPGSAAEYLKKTKTLLWEWMMTKCFGPRWCGMIPFPIFLTFPCNAAVGSSPDPFRKRCSLWFHCIALFHCLFLSDCHCSNISVHGLSAMGLVLPTENVLVVSFVYDEWLSNLKLCKQVPLSLFLWLLLFSGQADGAARWRWWCWKALWGWGRH